MFFYRRLLKDLQRLQQELEPTAALHRNRDRQALKALVQEVDSLVRGLPCADKLRLDLDLAAKGIITEATTKKPLKPQCPPEDD
jgi:hypothetical protein